MQNIYEAVSRNKRNSLLVVVFFVAFVTLSVYLISQGFSAYLGAAAPGGLGIAGLALIVSGIMSFVGYYFSDRIVLAISSARPADRTRDFLFFTAAENLAIGAGLPKPKLYVIEDSATNAFATGRDPQHAVICATSGLIDKLNKSELEGVLAHELSHIRNFDTRLASIVSVLVGLVALLGDWFLRASFRSSGSRDKKSGAGLLIVLALVFAILSPIIAQFIQLAISRKREFLADAGSVSITRQPQGLISALQKISADHEPLEVANKATAHLYIVNPFKEKGFGTRGWFANLFNTHPPLDERIKALKLMV